MITLEPSPEEQDSTAAIQLLTESPKDSDSDPQLNNKIYLMIHQPQTLEEEMDCYSGDNGKDHVLLELRSDLYQSPSLLLLMIRLLLLDKV